MKKIISVLILSLFAGSSAYAGDFEKGLEAAKQKNYDMAISLWAPLAQKGDMNAQYNLAIIYVNGFGVPVDYGKAAKLYIEAAEQGHALAQSDLGSLYSKGLGVPQDFTKASKWFLKAAQKGDAAAQLDLALIYVLGMGVKIDFTEAVKWYGKSADQGNKLAQHNLGVMYYFGKGVEKHDYIQAYFWLTLAMKSGHNNAQSYLDMVKKKMTPEQIAKAQKLAENWKPVQMRKTEAD